MKGSSCSRLPPPSAVVVAFVLLASLSAALGIGVGKITRGEEAVERVLGGLGSSPPTCRSKCGWCWPCRPVHVPVQAGLSMPLEYYPEAWRCRCGDKLYMP